MDISYLNGSTRILIFCYICVLFVIISLDRLSETGVNLNWIFIIIIGSL